MTNEMTYASMTSDIADMTEEELKAQINYEVIVFNRRSILKRVYSR